MSTSLPRLPRRLADQPVAENVLLADHGKPGRLEAGLERQHGDERSHRAAPRATSAKCSTRLVSPTPCSASSVASRSRAPLLQQATITRLPSPFSRLAWATTASNTLAPSVCRSARKGAALPSAERHDARGRFGLLERIERDHLPARKRPLPVRLAEEHALGRHGMIRRRAEGLALERLRARVVMVGDLLEPLARAHRPPAGRG